MKKSDKFSSLSETMFIVQLEEFCDNFNQDMHQKESAAMKKFIKALIPLGIGGVISVATANPLFVCLGVACFGGSAIIQIIKDAKEEDRKIAESDAQLLRDLQNAQAKKEGKKTEEKIVHLDQTNNLEAQVWGINPIIAHKDSDFYTDQLKELMEEKESSEEFRPQLELVKPEKPLNKDETQTKIVREYEMYCLAYQIPEMKISPTHWDILFDTIYERLEELNLTEEFYSLMNFLLKYVLSTSLIHNKRNITIYSFIEKIPKLEIIGFDSREAKNLASIIDKKMSPSNKVVDFKSLQYKR